MTEDRSRILAGRRRALELKPLEAWLTHGRGGYHFENLKSVAFAVNAFLWLTGLKKRGEENALRLVVRRESLAFPDLPPAFHGFRVLHLSDLHLDGIPDLPGALTEAVSGIEADLCVMTGDYRFDVDGHAECVYPLMTELLAALKAPMVLGILGNHDFQEKVPVLEGMGVVMLVNRAAEIRRGGESLWFVGVDDPHYYGTDDLDGARAPVPAGGWSVLLAHSPELYREAGAAGFRLYLCGHTHAGQIRLPLVGAPYINASCPRRYTAGLWRLGGMVGYTSAGVGVSAVPVRFGCPPEVTVFELLVAGSGPPERREAGSILVRH